MRAVVILNGEPDPAAMILAAAERADLIVAADGGARHALKVGVIPNLIVGDMDSLGEDGAREAEGWGAALERHPARKDKMDGHLAILTARDRGATSVELLCASGGRASAVFAVPHLLLAAERLGLQATVLSEWGGAFVLEAGERTVAGKAGDGVSVFPFVGSAAGVTLAGFAYPLEDARLEAGDTLGFHNELVGQEGRVGVGSGALLVIHETEEIRT